MKIMLMRFCLCELFNFHNKREVTDLRPGYVDTAMAQGDGLFWVAPVEKAAQQIFAAIKRKKKVVYKSKRWRIIAVLLKALPYSIRRKL